MRIWAQAAPSELSVDDLRHQIQVETRRTEPGVLAY